MIIKLQAAIALVLGALISIFGSTNIWCVNPGSGDMPCEMAGVIWAFEFFIFGFGPLCLIIVFSKWWWKNKPRLILFRSMLLGLVYGVLLPIKVLVNLYIADTINIEISQIIFWAFPLATTICLVILPLRWYSKNLNAEF